MVGDAAVHHNENKLFLFVHARKVRNCCEVRKVDVELQCYSISYEIEGRIADRLRKEECIGLEVDGSGGSRRVKDVRQSSTACTRSL